MVIALVTVFFFAVLTRDIQSWTLEDKFPTYLLFFLLYTINLFQKVKVAEYSFAGGQQWLAWRRVF